MAMKLDTAQRMIDKINNKIIGSVLEGSKKAEQCWFGDGIGGKKLEACCRD